MGQLGQRGVDIREGKHRESAEPPRMTGEEFGVEMVGFPGQHPHQVAIAAGRSAVEQRHDCGGGPVTIQHLQRGPCASQGR